MVNLDELNEDQKKEYNEQCEWFKGQNIAPPEAMIFERVKNAKKEYTELLKDLDEDQNIDTVLTANVQDEGVLAVMVSNGKVVGQIPIVAMYNVIHELMLNIIDMRKHKHGDEYAEVRKQIIEATKDLLYSHCGYVSHQQFDDPNQDKNEG